MFTASPFLLRFYRTFPNLYIDDKTIKLSKNLKLIPEKPFFVLLTVRYFGHEVGFMIQQFSPK